MTTYVVLLVVVLVVAVAILGLLYALVSRAEHRGRSR